MVYVLLKGVDLRSGKVGEFCSTAIFRVRRWNQKRLDSWPTALYCGRRKGEGSQKRRNETTHCSCKVKRELGSKEVEVGGILGKWREGPVL